MITVQNPGRLDLPANEARGSLRYRNRTGSQILLANQSQRKKWQHFPHRLTMIGLLTFLYQSSFLSRRNNQQLS